MGGTLLAFPSSGSITRELIHTAQVTIPKITTTNFGTYAYNTTRDRAKLKLVATDFIVPEVEYAKAIEMEVISNVSVVYKRSIRKYTLFLTLRFTPPHYETISYNISEHPNDVTTTTIHNAFQHTYSGNRQWKNEYGSISADGSTTTYIRLDIVSSSSSSDDQSTISVSGGQLTLNFYSIW